jgi:hypothetical protein
MRRAFKAALLGLMGFGLVAAAPPPGFTPPKWLRKPRPEDMLRVWPAKAMTDHVSGKATIHCKVNTVGTLYDCRVVDEFPKSSGFGSAAIVLSAQFLLSPALQDGVPVAFDGVTLPIDFIPPEGPSGTRLRGAGYFRDPGDMLLASDLAWRVTPTVVEMAAAYPPKAAAARMPGRVVLHCYFDDQGHTRTCDTASEEPKGEGFASAARGLAKLFVAPATFGEGHSISQAQGQISFTFTPDLLDKPPNSPRPNWAGLPEADALADAFPAKARAAGLKTSRVVLGCMAGTTGGLEACEVQTEDQPGYGFGEAALRLVPAFRMKTWSDDGRPMVGGRVRIPLRFEDDQAPAKP